MDDTMLSDGFCSDFRRHNSCSYSPVKRIDSENLPRLIRNWLELTA
jgi:hypothetical protein